MAKTTPDLRLELARLAPIFQQSFRRAVRLHPRRVAVPQSPSISKAGGLFLWPAAEPWPVCNEHEPDYREKVAHNQPFVPLLQLFKRDFPEFPFPDACDVFQLLWCPWVHENDDQPAGWKVYWRRSEACEPAVKEVPQASLNCVNECSLTPEAINDMPSWLELAQESECLDDFARRLLGDDASDRYLELGGSTAPGLKLFGWPDWIQYSVTRNCGCGKRMEPLLSVTNSEFADPTAESWCPLEDQAEHKNLMSAYWQLGDPSRYQEFARHSHPIGFDIGDSGSIYLLYCPDCPGPKIDAVVQYY